MPSVLGLLCDVLERQWVHLVRQRLGPALPERLDVRDDVPGWDVCGQQQCLPAVLGQLRDVHGERGDVRDVPGGPALLRGHQLVRGRVPGGPVAQRHLLHAVPCGHVRHVLHPMQLRLGRHLQCWLHRRR